MADFSGFRISPNIEDRQNEVLPRGVFGGYGLPENVFDVGDGTMSALNAATDFVPQPNTPSPLSVALGINSLPNVNGQPIFANKPQGLFDSTPAPPQDNGRIAYDYFVNNGYAPHQAAGIVGNLQGESGQGLSPTAVSRGDGRDGSDSIGIGQWNGDRAQALKAYAASKGTSANDLTTQLEFLHSELNGSEKAAGNQLMAAKTPAEAVQAMLAYERPKNWNVPGAHQDRTQNAARAFATYANGAPAGTAAPANRLLAGMPPQPAPIFPGQPQAPQQQAAADPSPLEQIPQAQAPPIFYAPRKPINLSALRAALSGYPKG